MSPSEIPEDARHAFPGYRVERELGSGGMATVYLAEDLKHRRRVALKVIKPTVARSIGGERRRGRRPSVERTGASTAAKSAAGLDWIREQVPTHRAARPPRDVMTNRQRGIA